MKNTVSVPDSDPWQTNKVYIWFSPLEEWFFSAKVRKVFFKNDNLIRVFFCFELSYSTMNQLQRSLCVEIVLNATWEPKVWFLGGLILRFWTYSENKLAQIGNNIPQTKRVEKNVVKQKKVVMIIWKIFFFCSNW